MAPATVSTEDDARTAKLSAGYKDGKPDRRWLDERILELRIRKREIAEALQVHPNIVHKMLNGERRVQIAELRLWARLLEIPFAQCVARFGFELPGNSCPLIGAVNGTGRVSLKPPRPDARIASPEGAGAALVALAVEAAHSELSVYDGSVIYYEPAATVRIDSFGRLAILEIDGEPAPIVGVLDRASMGRGNVTVFGGIETIATTRLVSATPVLWQRFG